MFFILGVVYLLSLYLLGAIGTGLLGCFLIAKFRHRLNGGIGELASIIALLHVFSFLMNNKVWFGFNVCLPLNSHFLDALKTWINLDLDLKDLFYGALATAMPFSGLAIYCYISEKTDSEIMELIGSICALTTFFFLLLIVFFHNTALVRWWAHYVWF
jgi:hypothetical protein